MSISETLSIPEALAGFVKIWRVQPETGESELLVDKQNMILKGGAKLITHALAGDAGAKIWGMYIGFNNGTSFTAPSIDVDYANPFSGFTAPFGYLREPLTFSPSFMSTAGYEDNTVLFSTMITSANSAGGGVFSASSKIYEVALVSAPDPTSPTDDTVFSRTSFNPIQYNSSFNFTITWGVRVLLP